MTERTRAEKEKAIKRLEIAMLGVVLTFIILASFFYLGIIESSKCAQI